MTKSQTAHKNYQKEIMQEDLFLLIREDELGAMEDLIDDGADPLYNHHEPLEVACEHHKFEIAKHLIKKYKSNINVRDGAILKQAVKNCDYKILDFLVENGANLDVSANGRTALMMACAREDEQMVAYLLKNKADHFALGSKILELISSSSMLDAFLGPFTSKELIENVTKLDGLKKFKTVYDETTGEESSVVDEEFVSYLTDVVNKIGVLKIIKGA